MAQRLAIACAALSIATALDGCSGCPGIAIDPVDVRVELADGTLVDDASITCIDDTGSARTFGPTGRIQCGSAGQNTVIVTRGSLRIERDVTVSVDDEGNSACALPLTAYVVVVIDEGA